MLIAICRPVVLSPNCVTAAPLRFGLGGALNKPDMRIKISVGAMPCMIGVSSQQRLSAQGTNTHVDLWGNSHEDVLSGMPNGVEDAVDKLHGQIEHAALDNDGNCSSTRSRREVWEYVVSLVRGEIPDADDYEGSHTRVHANRNNKGRMTQCF